MLVSPHLCQTHLIFANLIEGGISKYLIYTFLILNKVEHLSNVLYLFFYANYLYVTFACFPIGL